MTTQGKQPSPSDRPVVVGYDDSAASRAALYWAAREAVDSHQPLHVVTGWTHDVGGSWGRAVRAGQAWAEEALEQAGRAARSVVLDRVTVSTEAVQADAVDALVEASQGASILVLGTRGHLGALGAVLGSISRECVRRSTVPVVLLGPDADPSADLRVVVAARDGAAAGPAVQWATARAVDRGHELLLLDRWGGRAMGAELSFAETRSGALAEAERRHRAALDELRAAVHGAARVTGHLIEGRGVDVEYAATGAGDLLVVDLEDAEHRPSLRYERCPVVLVPPGTSSEQTAQRPGQTRIPG